MATAPSKQVVKPWEVRFAYLLLHYLHANVNNVYLLLSVIAWIRGENGTQYNPLNLPHRSFSSVTAAAYATAQFLAGHTQYKTLLAAIRRGTKSTADMQTQGIDVLTAVAMSAWDGHYYGTRTLVYNKRYAEWVLSPFDNSKNLLISLWANLLGHPVTIPADVLPQPKPLPTPAPRPAPPKGTIHPIDNPNYLPPYGALQFYEGRRAPTPVVPA